ncbi:unnamed protein product [Brassica rapa]|uniref:Myb/SANT-like domain-containing protein n=2 Tax=Brassica TaxID=3705 RepID=A0A8D9HLI8_BRACM|nr:unnamed protein product [Brassica napus]CAG7901968.1 unnamed protein product [Brassica rapa]
MSNNENVDDAGVGADDGGGTTRRKKQKQIIWEDEHVGVFLELLDIELAKIRYRQKLSKEVGRERICKEFLEKTGISLFWEPFKSKYDILRNMYGSYKRLKNFTGVSADDNTGLITKLQMLILKIEIAVVKHNKDDGLKKKSLVDFKKKK